MLNTLIWNVFHLLLLHLLGTEIEELKAHDGVLLLLGRVY